MSNVKQSKQIEPWWLRLVILFSIGIPALTGWPVNIATESLKEILHATPEITSIFVWTVYACFIWVVIFLIAGEKKLLEYLAVAFILGLTTSILGAIMRKAFPFIAGGLSGDEVSFKMVKLCIIIITVVPYSILVVNSFSPKSLIERLSKMNGKFKTVGLHFALAFRVFQHAGEVIFNLFEIWSEEHPEKLFPRHRREWGVKWYSITSVFPWIWGAVFAWIFACIIQTFEPIPAMVDDVEKINKFNSKGG
jgi:hypothetical protein